MGYEQSGRLASEPQQQKLTWCASWVSVPLVLLHVLSAPVRSTASEKLNSCKYFTKGTFSPIIWWQKISRRRYVLRKSSWEDYILWLIEFSHKLISKIQPVVTQVLRSPKENRTNRYSTYHDEEHAETKHHTHPDIHSTTTPCSFLPVPHSDEHTTEEIY